MPRVLAEGRTKFVILTTAPTNPAQPTTTELNAGLDLSCKTLADDFTFGAVDSDKVGEKALCDSGNANAFGASNFQMALTLFRYYLAAGGIDTTADAGFTALKLKGTTLWAYARQTEKVYSAAFATGDEIYLGAEFTNDNAQRPGNGGWTKWRIPCEVQRAWPFITLV